MSVGMHDRHLDQVRFCREGIIVNNRSLFRLQVRVQQVCAEIRDSERGQTMVEYAGIGLIVVAIVAAVAAALADADGGIGEAITGKISEIIGGISTSTD